MSFSKLYVAVLLLLFVLSCSDDEGTDSSAGVLLGTWKLTELDCEGTGTIPGPTGLLSSNFSGEGFDMDLRVEFSADPNTYTTEGDHGIRLEVEVLGQPNTLELKNQNFFGEGTWTRDNDKLVLTSSGDVEQEATILELNGSTMRISADISDLAISLGTINEMEANFVFTKE